MSRLDQVYKSLECLTKFLQPALPFINSHLVDYATKSHWEYFLPEKLRLDLESQTVADLKRHISNLANGSWTSENSTARRNDVNFQTAESLDELIFCVGQLLPSTTGLSVPRLEVKINEKSIETKDFTNKNFLKAELKFDPIMSAKKMHEVEVMSEFIVKVTNSFFVNQPNRTESVEYLVDVGSGKGYLSSYLALLYQFRVLAIDSSTVNTKGCEKRSANLQKLWSQLLRRAVEKRTLGECSKRGKRWRARAAKENSESQTENNNEEENTTNSALLKNETLFVTENADLAEMLTTKFNLDSSDNGYVEANNNFGLIGLHTCGNLGVDSLRLFVANEKARFILNVPCCFHLLDEISTPSESRCGGSVFWNSEYGALATGGVTFPISDYFKVDNSFSLGRNARMISSQSLHRMSTEENDLQFPRTMLYRVLLQVLIQENLGHTLVEYNVGRIGEKCANFNEYVRKALPKLHLEKAIQVTDAEIEDLYRSFDEHKRNRLHMYFLLRSIFAPLVEGCILMDRLAFLLEKDCIKEAKLVQLFDPNLSPRCHAILAVK